MNHIYFSMFLQVIHEHGDVCVVHRAVLVDPRTLNKEMLLLLERHG